MGTLKNIILIQWKKYQKYGYTQKYYIKILRWLYIYKKYPENYKNCAYTIKNKTESIIKNFVQIFIFLLWTIIKENKYHNNNILYNIS